jgi:ABC-2 type transport system ATP-binding protein
MISVHNLSIKFSSILAVENVSFTLKNGVIYGMIGPNGAGKSSIIKAMVGIISEYSGNITYDDLSVLTDKHMIKQKLGYAPEDIELLPFLTGNEYLHMLSDIRQLSQTGEDISTLLKNLKLDKVKDVIVDRYSHGMKQKLSLASALIGDPENIILDEALNGLDPISMLNIKNKLKELANAGHVILLTSHILELVENLCQQILILNEGKLLDQISQEKIQRIKDTTGKDFNEYFVDIINKKSSRK